MTVKHQPAPHSKVLATAENTLPAVAGDFAVMQVSDTDLREIYETNMGAEGLKWTDLMQIKVPVGGNLMWMIPDGGEGQTAAKEISGVIIAVKDLRGYWSKPFGTGGGSQPPDCSSQNGVRGEGLYGGGSEGNPSGLCRNCPMSEWGTAVGQDGKERRGQACQQKRLLVMIPPDSLIPVVLRLPATSLKTAKQFFLYQLTGKQRRYWEVLVTVALIKATSGDGIAYAQAEFKPPKLLNESEKARFAALHEVLEPVLTAAHVAVEPEDDKAPF